jgi:hypothetical protein
MDQSVFLKQMHAIQAATKNARQRTGNDQIGTTASSGGLRVCYYIPKKNGRFDVKYLTPVLPLNEAIEYLNAL